MRVVVFAKVQEQVKFESPRTRKLAYRPNLYPTRHKSKSLNENFGANSWFIIQSFRNGSLKTLSYKKLTAVY